MWTLAEGIEYARKIELALDGRAHVALGGSVLHQGASKNDLDIFIYPHQGNHTRQDVMGWIAPHLNIWPPYDLKEKLYFKYDIKDVYKITQPDNRVVDFFILYSKAQ